MSVEIEFPLEFVVEGTPVSHQGKERKSIERWKSRVIEASRTALPEGHFATEVPLAITLFYFPAGSMEGDLDNIVMATINYMIYPITIVRYFQETMYVDVDSLRCVQISARAAWTEHGQSLQVIVKFV